MRVLITTVLLLILGTAHAGHNSFPLIPYPQSVEFTGNSRVLFDCINVNLNGVDGTTANAIITQISRFQPGLKVAVKPSSRCLRVNFTASKDGTLAAEGYRLGIKGRSVIVEYTDNGGCFYAIQTLIQLINIAKDKYSIPEVTITDSPKFRFRGFMHDVGRNFQTIQDLKRQMDILAFYKINVFHWHLTDHPAWRIQCNAYPQLNDPQFQRKGRDQGAFYTYQQIRELITYAKARNILVIPEIDVPGHSAYFKEAFGFTMDSPQGVKVLERCLEEFFYEIPRKDCPYIHLGSDEVHIGDPSGFMAKMEQIVKKSSRTAIVWNPGLKASPATINQIWKDASFTSEDKKEGINTSSPFFDSSIGYINGYDPLILVNRIALNMACGKPNGDSLALGGIICCWPDVKVDRKENIFRHNPVWPAVLAFSERYWRGGKLSNVNNPNLLEMNDSTMVLLADLESRMMIHKNHYFMKEPFPWSANSMIRWNVAVPFKFSKYWNSGKESLQIGELPQDLKWRSFSGGTIDMESVRRDEKVDNIDSLMAFAYSKIFSQSDMDVSCWIGFETPARSNRQYSGIPQTGSWDANGGDIWVNGCRVAPPDWQNPGGYKCLSPTWARPEEEIPYTDEEFYWTRNRVNVHFKKGENVVLVKVPKLYKSQRWTFTFVPLSTEGLKFDTIK